jgi:hypothetical protein
VSSVFSFVSIKTNDPRRENLLESIADYLFIFSLMGIFSIIIFIIITFWQK